LLMFYPLFGAPTGFGATVIVSGLLLRRCSSKRNLGRHADQRIPNDGLIRT